LQITTTNARWFQMFKYEANTGRIINEKGKVVQPQGPYKDADQQSRYIHVLP